MENVRAGTGLLPNLSAMSTFAADAQALAGLAEVLGTLGDELAVVADGDLADSLHDLRIAVIEAARQYAAAETEVASSLPGGDPLR